MRCNSVFFSSFIIKTIFSIMIVMFVISSLRFIYEVPSLKKDIDVFRLFIVCFIFLIFLIKTKINMAILVFSLISIPYVLLKLDVFGFQVVVGLIISWTVFNFDHKQIVIQSIQVTNFLLIIVIFLVKFGMLEATVGVNNLASQSDLIVANKYDWGFWHPNVVSFFAVGCIICSFYYSSYKTYILSLIVYAFILTATVSRTFILVPVLTLFFLFFEVLSISKKRYFLFIIILFYLLSVFLSLFFVFPDLTFYILGDKLFYSLDVILSYRLSIAQRVLGELSFFELLSGFHEKNVEVDSFYINFVLSFGVFIYVLLVFFLVYTGLLAFIRRNSKEIFFLSIFLLLSNFEKMSGINSLFYITACVSLFRIYKLDYKIYVAQYFSLIKSSLKELNTKP